MKFRIVELIHNVSELKRHNIDPYNQTKIEWVIEKKNLWGCWKEVFHKELTSHRISHKSYEDAEAYMIDKYMGHGICRKIGNEYEYQSYTYYV